MTTRPRTTETKIAVIGAGISGLTAARSLHDAGFAVRVFEKSRGMGGRMSTRRRDAFAFDHGAQYFTARSPGFRQALLDWEAAHVASPWEARIVDLEGGRVRPRDNRHPRYVGVPRMNLVCKHLGAPLDVVTGTRVTAVEATGTRWRLTSEGGADLGAFDAVLSSAPPAQAKPLMAAAPALVAAIAPARMEPCWAWMAVFDTPLDVPYDAAFVASSPLSWIACNSSKPGRDTPEGHEVWIAHGSPAWSAAHVDTTPVESEALLAAAFADATGVTTVASQTMVHRWLYASCTEPLHEDCLYDPALRLGVCGDWVVGGKVEGAWRSGRALAARVLTSLTPA